MQIISKISILGYLMNDWYYSSSRNSIFKFNL